MNAAVLTDHAGDRVRLTPVGTFDLANAEAVARSVAAAERDLGKCRAVDIDLSAIERIDGTGAALLARFLDRLESGSVAMRIEEAGNPEAARLIVLYRERRSNGTAARSNIPGALARIGAAALEIPAKAGNALDFTGRCAMAVPRTIARPRSVDWGALPRALQEIGADSLPVTSAANLLVGLIIGFLGVSQLGRFGAVTRVPELVVVAHFRELGPLVTAIVVAGRSGAGLASEIATMKVSEEVDALRAMGFDPVRWLVVPRCLALVVSVPLLTWIGNLVALLGGWLATSAMTDMTPRAYFTATAEAVTLENLFGGLLKSPFLALAIGLIACGQGLATRGGAAAVGARTKSAVVLAIFGVIVINAVFTFIYALVGI